MCGIVKEQLLVMIDEHLAATIGGDRSRTQEDMFYEFHSCGAPLFMGKKETIVSI